MRRFLFNSGVLGSIFGVVAVIKATQRGPRDWRLILMWVGWAITVAIAIGTVIEQEQHAGELED